MPPNQVDADTIRVSVVPSQSSYFAGEQFSVAITFTNTRAANEPTKRTASNSHKRGAHSISSAPLARPPTSPVTPRTAQPVLAAFRDGRGGNKIARRGVIGQGGKGGDDTPKDEQSKKTPTRSLSVTISPQDLHAVLAQASPRISPTLARDPSLPLAANHPHARKPSVLDVQTQLQDIPLPIPPSTVSTRKPPSLTRDSALPIATSHPHSRKQSVMDGQVQLHDIPSSPSPSPFPSSAAASTSAFSLSLDPISEGAQSAFPQTPSFPSPLDVHVYPPTPEKHSYPPRPGRRPSQLGLGHGPPPPIHPPPPRTAVSSTFPQPNTELILYSYAQLVGTLTLAAPPETAQTAQHVQTLGAVRGALLKRQAVGGGSMDISSSLHAGPRGSLKRSHSRSTSISSSILSLLSPSPSSPSPSSSAQSWSPGHKARSPSMFSSFLSQSTSFPASRSGLGLSVGDASEDDVDPETLLPTFEVQPAMLAVDLGLGPGESRTYTYSLALPDNLPPTFKGRALKFSYHLVVGVCRAGSSAPNGVASPAGHGGSSNSTSRVMRVPIRVYNNVIVAGFQRPYDLLWPVAKPRKEVEATVTEEYIKPGKGKGLAKTAPSPSLGSSDSIDGLREYAERLLSAFPDPLSTGVRIKLPIEAVSPSRDRDREAGELSGCREAVEILTRNPRKVSYDVNKEGVKVAVLTFVKSAYRLGETVLGVVELNGRPNRARVLKLSAMLEAHESLPSSLSPPSLSRHLRKVHAEHHSSLVPTTLRTTFALDIPSDASPAFQCDVSGHKSATGAGGLEWKVRLCLLVAVASENAREGFDGVKVKHMVRDGPRGEWGSAWRATNSIAPLERPDPRRVVFGDAANGGTATSQVVPPKTPTTPQTARGWASYFISSLLLPGGEREYHDGDEDDDDDDGDKAGDTGLMDEYGEVDFGGGEEGWNELRVETVECEVPIKVWPGNTAFRPLEVLFDV